MVLVNVLTLHMQWVGLQREKSNDAYSVQRKIAFVYDGIEQIPKQVRLNTRAFIGTNWLRPRKRPSVIASGAESLRRFGSTSDVATSLFTHQNDALREAVVSKFSGLLRQLLNRTTRGWQ